MTGQAVKVIKNKPERVTYVQMSWIILKTRRDYVLAIRSTSLPERLSFSPSRPVRRAKVRRTWTPARKPLTSREFRRQGRRENRVIKLLLPSLPPAPSTIAGAPGHDPPGYPSASVAELRSRGNSVSSNEVHRYIRYIPRAELRTT